MAKALDSGLLSAFCDSVAMMIEAGMQPDEAVFVFKENLGGSSRLKRACDSVYTSLINGDGMAAGMLDAGSFPVYAVEMVKAGEQSGCLENVLRSLAVYYNEEERLYNKMHSAVAYPAALLVVMTVILLFTVLAVLPVFASVYDSIADALSTDAYTYMRVGNALGYLALVIMGIGAIGAVVASFMCNGRSDNMLFKVMSVLPKSSDAMYHLALSRFTAALATYTSAGFSTEEALAASSGVIDNGRLLKKVSRVRAAVAGGNTSLPEAVAANNLFDPIYNTVLEVSDRSGARERALQNLSNIFFDDAVMRTDSLIDSMEPVSAVFLTAGVGATLIAVMLPLIGIMGSIG